MSKLFLFRQTSLFFLLLSISFCAQAQLVDGVLGQRRSVVQVLLKPYRIIDYKMEREVHSVEKGIHQTVLFEDDTCRRFYWVVTPEKMDRFKSMLASNGYKNVPDNGFVKDSLQLKVKPLKSGKATLFIASLSKELKGERTVSGIKVIKKKVVNLEALPLLQQAILAEEQDTTPKPPKDPTRHWIGGRYGKTSILGWEK